MTGWARLRIEESSPLLHALVARTARDSGTRALIIKGPLAEVQGLREHKTSADVDVLVHPCDLNRYLAALTAYGWTRVRVSATPSILPSHAVTLTHRRWPQTVDVHHYFPGMLAEAGRVFEALWQRRHSVDFAGVEVQGADPPTQTVILALHQLREPWLALNKEGLEYLALNAPRVLGRQGVDEMLEVARITGALLPLEPFLERIGVEAESPRPEEATAAGDWLLQSEERFAGAPWLIELSRTPVRRWPRLMWRGLVSTPEDLRSFHGPGAAESLGGLWRLRWSRARRGARSYPPAIALLLRSRWRGRRDNVLHPRQGGTCDQHPPRTWRSRSLRRRRMRAGG